MASSMHAFFGVCAFAVAFAHALESRAEGCEDTNPQCAADWFKTSQCTQAYWADQCKKTCNSCSGGGSSTASPPSASPSPHEAGKGLLPFKIETCTSSGCSP